ncbi:hypothetical protein [Kordiimonas sp.]|uniref:hypothetical protein n=1 Tax=Kordiimonas sp. TaxID=1970157 RepID=UPI003A9314C9
MMAEDKKVTSEIHSSHNQDGEVLGGMEQVTEELQSVANQHRGLKMLVLVLGLVLIALFAFVVYAIANRAAESFLSADEPAAESPVASDEESGVEGSDAFTEGDFSVARPAGTELLSVTGTPAELIFHFRDRSGGDLIVLLDRVSGQQTVVSVP